MFCYTFSNNSKNKFNLESNRMNNSSMDILDFIALPYPPDLIYRDVNDTHYQWCGPYIHLAEYFAKFTRTR